jgi:hypothetical protein
MGLTPASTLAAMPSGTLAIALGRPAKESLRRSSLDGLRETNQCRAGAMEKFKGALYVLADLCVHSVFRPLHCSCRLAGLTHRKTA